MDKSQLVKNWVRWSGADAFFKNKRKAFGLGWKLLQNYLFFRETGRCPDTGNKLYDFTEFLDTFADRYAGQDDQLYDWIVQRGHTIIDAIHQEEIVKGDIPNAHCPLCSLPLTKENVARDHEGKVRKSSLGRAWCKDCYQKVDSKKWFDSN